MTFTDARTSVSAQATVPAWIELTWYTVSALLNEAKFDPKTDHLIFSGDMISKGPSSPSVVDFAMSAEASCVRGNHEDRVLLTARDYMVHGSIGKKKNKPPMPGIPEEASEPEDATLDDEPEELTRLDAADRLLAQQLSKRQLEYLAKCPIIVDIGQVPGMGRAQVVHAGLIPGIVLESQDPVAAMHMRTVDLETHVPSSKGQGTPWFKVCHSEIMYNPKIPEQSFNIVAC